MPRSRPQWLLYIALIIRLIGFLLAVSLLVLFVLCKAGHGGHRGDAWAIFPVIIISLLTSIPELTSLLHTGESRRFSCAPAGRFAADFLAAIAAGGLGALFALTVWGCYCPEDNVEDPGCTRCDSPRYVLAAVDVTWAVGGYHFCMALFSCFDYCCVVGPIRQRRLAGIPLSSAARA